MSKLIVGIGIPGSGKTSILKKFAAEHGYAYICPDDIREELTGNASDQSRNAEVWGKARKKLQEFLKQDLIIVFDATFANQDQRKDFLAFARENGAEKIQGVHVSVPLEIAKERNQGRIRQVPERVLERMENELKNSPPNETDGFDSVCTINGNENLAAAEMNEKETILYREIAKRFS